MFGVVSACGGGMCGACVLVLRCLLCACGECWVCVEMLSVYVCVHTHGGSGTCVCARANACTCPHARVH